MYKEDVMSKNHTTAKEETIIVHGINQCHTTSMDLVSPIHMTSTFKFTDQPHAQAVFEGSSPGYLYSRISNPTVAVLEERVAALEGGVGAVCTASGMAAIHLGLTTITGAGGHIVASRSLYGGTHNLLSYTLPRFGIETSFVDPQDPDAIAAAIRPETRVVFAETVANPRCEVLDIPKVSAIAHAAGVPLNLKFTQSNFRYCLYQVQACCSSQSVNHPILIKRYCWHLIYLLKITLFLV